ncbi:MULTISPECIES: hypothetical protein [Acinetobacter]|uniref:hypothetical protein n=1 Tax=Acinetobacter TaxID=469 RepID=UPI000EA19485|nr:MULTISPECIES: hypothetical protein [Acinetobacter]MDP6003892.1 hypothetical protein [Acinetobacter bereziniae]RKG37339.1 hypothetical protein D7V31_16690 [Acinetobacter sp. WCHAc060007]UUS66845.1 hypothetical protein MST18_16285 [Acinetobacter sp. YH12068_T]WMW76876.1 hypothetical protein RG306_21510 [Acinetobacter bereziniae]
MMQDQNILKFDSENSDNINSEFSTDNSFEAPQESNSKPSKLVEKNQKIYSKNDSKNFENILLCYIKELNEKTITRNQLLTQHKKTLLQLFGLGATTGEVLDFLKRNNFVGITEETLKEFLKKKK